jgi:hypothetical protein
VAGPRVECDGAALTRCGRKRARGASIASSIPRWPATVRFVGRSKRSCRACLAGARFRRNQVAIPMNARRWPLATFRWRISAVAARGRFRHQFAAGA